MVSLKSSVSPQYPPPQKKSLEKRLSPLLRLALLLYLVEAMSGCWIVEQPSLSLLRYHPRVMEAFRNFKVSWFQLYKESFVFFLI